MPKETQSPCNSSSCSSIPGCCHHSSLPLCCVEAGICWWNLPLHCSCSDASAAHCPVLVSALMLLFPCLQWECGGAPTMQFFPRVSSLKISGSGAWKRNFKIILSVLPCTGKFSSALNSCGVSELLVLVSVTNVGILFVVFDWTFCYSIKKVSWNTIGV